MEMKMGIETEMETETTGEEGKKNTKNMNDTKWEGRRKNAEYTGHTPNLPSRWVLHVRLGLRLRTLCNCFEMGIVPIIRFVSFCESK